MPLSLRQPFPVGVCRYVGLHDPSAIFVDAGFLIAVGGTHVAGTSLRSAFRVDYEKLIQGILKRTAEHSGMDVLRVYWYDASKDALFTDEHKRIGLLPDVKVRLGRIAAEMRATGELDFLDWGPRRQVPEDGYRLTR